MKNKFSKGYKPRKKPKKKHKERNYVSKLIMPFGKKASITERIIKIIIYIGLRIIIPNRKWKEPEKNFEIIDRTYKRIMSNDFIYIPSSIAFYFLMAFMPVLAIIHYTMLLPGIETIFGSTSNLDRTLASFIPGIGQILKELKNFQTGSIAVNASIILMVLTSLWIASSGFAKLIYTQSYLYDYKYVGGYWMNKFKGMFIVFSFSLILIIALLINIKIDELVSDWNISKNSKTAFKAFYLYSGALILVFVLYIGLFILTPRYKIKIRHILPGAAVSTIPTTIFIGVFGFITRYWSYDNYGGIGSIMYIATSALIISYFMFVGLACNVSYYQTFVGRALKKKWSFSKK